MTQPLLASHLLGSALASAWLLTVYAISVQSMVIRRVRANEREAAVAWWLGGALVVGTGIWAGSFLTLVALKLPVKVGYVRDVVMASWLPAVVVCAVTLWLQTHVRSSVKLRVMGGILVTLGLCMLMFVNASSIMIQPGLLWDGDRLAAAVATFLAGSALGSWLLRKDLSRPPHQGRHLAVAVVLGTVLWGGMTLQVSSIGVAYNAVCLSADQLSGESLQLVLTVAVLILLVMTHVGTLQDARALARAQVLSESLQEAKEALEEASQRDAVTGLPNRLGFERQLRDLIEAPRDAALHLCVLRLNVDGFHAFAATYGHALGDNLVQTLALRLRGHVREGDVLARSDTDEFLLACHGFSDERAMTVLAQRLQESVHVPCLIQDQDIVVSSSIGIARYPDSASAEQLIAHSNDAMLTARRAGGGVYCFYERGMDRAGAAQVEMQRDLRHAVERQELQLYFQPKLRSTTGDLAGVEALLRWHHPKRGMVSPAEFIPVAERFGLIGELGLWVLDEACRHLRMWHEAGLDIPVAVNLSVHQLRQPDLEQRVREALHKHRVPARMLIMEITESVAMEDIEASLRVFDMLDQIGVRLSIDDFGTGYSSLSYLRRLPARQLKIDRSFVRDLDSSLDAQAIVEAVVRLAHALGLKVVAEGVETQDQADILAQLQCDELQGFLFARPMSEHTLLNWLRQRGKPVPPTQVRQEASPTGARREADDDDLVTAWSDLEATHL
ncbi:MAG: EAL domain-containing protein [Proteobacteria bacterium]|uniref:putative bifunctional diguanylate cyclase/phosphodiesterase n=1 Tax=Aquabacterium sp. TaxID=1872578 RepID=UPI0035C70CE7|nr:EAL domain-containing protein [Pseudomonadota bacterium]